MSEWFSKAKKALRPAEPETQQSFRVLCECGQEHTGLRRQKHQHLTCKTCGRSVFVLSRDIYPQPAVISAAKVPVEPQSNDKPASIAILKKRTRGKNAPAESVPSAALSQKPALAKSPAAPKSKGKPANGLQSLPEVKFWSPFRIVALSVFLIGLCTTVWLFRQSQVSQAAEIVRVNGAAGLALISSGDWDAARHELEPAAAALRTLGRKDPESLKIRQYFFETRAMSNLCADPLDKVYSTARDLWASRDEKQKKKAGLANQYLGQWVIVEGVIQDVTPPKTRRRKFEMTFPTRLSQLDGEAVLQVNFPVMENAIPKEGEQFAIFAGSIVDCHFEEDARRWVLQLNPDTGFLWSHLNTWQGAGFEFDAVRSKEVVEAELVRQGQMIGELP